MTKEERRAYQRQWERDNKDRVNANARARRAARKDELNAKARERYHLRKDKEKERKRLYYLNNKEKVTQRNKRWNEANPDKVKAAGLKWKKENPDKVKGWLTNWRVKNVEHEKEYQAANRDKERARNRKNRKIKYDTDPVYRLSQVLRASIIQSFGSRSYQKSTLTATILGCTFEEFKTYIESKFEPWMNWLNHGLYNGEPGYGWDLDHNIPLSVSDSALEVECLNFYTNFQPLCSYINRDVKKDKVIY